MRFESLFTKEDEYPTDIASSPLPLGTLYHYVSSSFLNGFINYVIFVDGYVIHRYVEASSEKKTKMEEAFNKHHTCLNSFGDDSLLLCKAANQWYFFWYDQDSSDCSIGRFPDNPDLNIPELFKTYVEGQNSRYTTPNEYDVVTAPYRIPRLNGWISG